MQEPIYFDPVEYFPPEVSINIFKMLSGDNLLTASVVSKDWYELIAHSRDCMRKIKVSFKRSNSQSHTFDTICLLSRSTRRYENLDIFECKNVQGLFQQTRKEWKSVKIARTTFNNMKKILDFLEGIENSVEELILHEVQVKNCFNSGAVRELTFPKLKTLHAKHVQKELFNEAFEGIRCLKAFELCSFGQSFASLQAVMNILKTNLNLKVLKISGSVFDKIMYHHDAVKEFRFKLDMLTINNLYCVSPYHDMIQKNLVLFLNSQKDSLRTLSFGDWTGVDALEAAFQITNLKNFTIKGLLNIEEIIDWKSVKLTLNKSIVKLCIFNAPDNVDMLKSLTDILPNLTCFSISFQDSQSVNSNELNVCDIQGAASRHVHVF